MKLGIDLKTFRKTGGKAVRLADEPTDIHRLYRDKSDYQKRMEGYHEEIDELQNLMYAHNRYGLLLIFQAMDAAGKDGTIREVIRGVNPHGVEVHAFKRPSEEELDHDFLWRSSQRMPPRGRIGVFNRSYYEEVLVVRVHPEIATHVQRLPSENTKDLDALWKGRFEDIRAFEAYAHRNGIHVLKFFLHVSKEEQGRRFLSRLEDESKNWKFALEDLKEREFWDSYQKAYEDAIEATSTKESPWCVIPADDKRNMRLIVAALVLEKLKSFDMAYPKPDPKRRQEFKALDAALRAEVKADKV